MPQTGENSKQRRARLREKSRQNAAVKEAKSTSPQAEIAANQTLEGQDQAINGDNHMDLFPSGVQPGEQPPDPMDETAVAPEEQAQYQQVVKLAAHAIYKAPNDIIAAINNKDEPIHVGVGRVAAQIGQAVQKSAEARGDKIAADVMFHAGDEVVGILLDLANQAGIIKLDPESEQYQKVHGLAMMEAEKIFGQGILSDPKKGPLASEEAGNHWMQQSAKEVDAGTASPEFVKMSQGLRNQRLQQSGVADGVSQALRGSGG